MQITKEIIQNAEGWKLNRLLAELLGWTYIEIYKNIGIPPGYKAKRIIPDWSNIFNKIWEEYTCILTVDAKLILYVDNLQGVRVELMFNDGLIGFYADHSNKPATALTRAFALFLLDRKHENENNRRNDSKC